MLKVEDDRMMQWMMHPCEWALGHSISESMMIKGEGHGDGSEHALRG